MLGICFYYFMDIVWTFDSQKAFNYFWSDDRLVFYKSRLYKRASGRYGYCYKTFWHYIINKKTQGDRPANMDGFTDVIIYDEKTV